MPTADQSEVAHARPILREAANETESLPRPGDRPAAVAATNNEKPGGTETQGAETKTPTEASTNTRNETTEFKGLPGSALPPTAYKVPQHATPAPEVGEARPEREPRVPPRDPGLRPAPSVPVSYTHLDVYKRQCSSAAVSSLPPVSVRLPTIPESLRRYLQSSCRTWPPPP